MVVPVLRPAVAAGLSGVVVVDLEKGVVGGFTATLGFRLGDSSPRAV